MKRLLVVTLLISSAFLVAEDKKPEAPKPIPTSMAAENNILKAEHDHDQVTAQQAAIVNEFNGIQQRQETLKKQYQDLVDKEAKTKKAIDDAIEAARVETCPDKDKWDFDAADFTCKPKVEQKAKVEPPAPKK